MPVDNNSNPVIFGLKLRIQHIKPHHGRILVCGFICVDPFPATLFSQQMGTVLGCTTRRRATSLLFAPDTVFDLGLNGGKGSGISNSNTKKTTPPTLELAIQPLQLIERMHIIPLAIRRLSRSSRKDGPSDSMRLIYPENGL
ncbi:hypothetical protein N7449_003766 [Penicillium cf. viridicatum]|uniref:Uncharacterized protein n=1 Tax=Penicillium cf. viridicatum TaxID=2972119 RepID=A0A9W9T4P5_9EURO|nr:hypothetical protein N7449_003766 [Penicillium cf. viridicatum]